MGQSFTPSRLTLARARRGHTKAVLAACSSISARSLSEYEAGRTTPTEPNVERLARALQFPVSFFSLPAVELQSPEASAFRSLSRMTAGRRESVLAAATMAAELNTWLGARFDLPSVDLPDLRDMEPEHAATALRSRWGLGEQPVRNMVHLLEVYGVRVYSLAEDTLDVDAFSTWRDGVPFVFLNTQKSAERGRFDAAHELAHLVLHRHGCPSGREAEMQANAFASAFLMPRANVLAAAPRLASLSHLRTLKHRWGVAVSALAHRLHDLGLVSEWHYRSLCIQIGQMGYRTNEPDGLQRESSQVLGKVFAALRTDRIRRVDVAAALCWTLEDLEALIFGLTLVPVSGAAPEGPSATDGARTPLQLVE